MAQFSYRKTGPALEIPWQHLVLVFPVFKKILCRYKFKDLYPCSLNELRAMGYETNDAEMKAK